MKSNWRAIWAITKVLMLFACLFMSVVVFFGGTKNFIVGMWMYIGAGSVLLRKDLGNLGKVSEMALFQLIFHIFLWPFSMLLYVKQKICSSL